MKPIAKLLHFGLAGHTLYFSDPPSTNCKCQGYEDPNSFIKPYHWSAHPPEQISTHWDGYAIPKDGIPVIDVRAAVGTPKGYRWVFAGPIVNVDLEPGSADILPDPDPFCARAIADSGQEYRAIFLYHVGTRRTEKRGSLDLVSVPHYVQGWKEHGARIGRFYVENGPGRIEWEIV